MHQITLPTTNGRKFPANPLQSFPAFGVLWPKCRELFFDMEIKGMAHCFFEQSGTFKNEFIKLGIPAADYDIQNNFGETDHVIDLFAEIENAYGGGAKYL